MTNSVIPYSFVPGTKAKASEVNANFASVVDYIDQTKTAINSSIEAQGDILETKADKTELVTNHDVTTASTDLNDYKTPGTYEFAEEYTPTNIPEGTSGTLIVIGTETKLKQIWISDDNKQIVYMRMYKDESWSDWYSPTPVSDACELILPAGIKIYWGYTLSKTLTYPLAYDSLCCPVFCKHGCGLNYERSDTGIVAATTVGFTIETGGIYNGMNYIVIGR